jgi:hypothetical protein
VRRDADELHERMDAVIRVAKAIKRTTEKPQPVAEEDYDALHAGTIRAHESLVLAWKEWASALEATQKWEAKR